ncbi:uncharacterized protein K460DRAFT_167274 [Cucurbitaria berberidis CBS 394.84]|uniref:Uncharacterized protein n=1 Tax=Cucurbitaria berberidis CBS 394.84 TaxID=1168544 RepID=A0A9P4G965_9PLEO|nr:uncharacterized protein K460DRAFT_167274 [Cucurbitaria berberidis CBS 394.84]KAF1841438.1 hypothetical protein K460DRAFT_167274 [Cucurbitaria berberidis CBS 394.84]
MQNRSLNTIVNDNYVPFLHITIRSSQKRWRIFPCSTFTHVRDQMYFWPLGSAPKIIGFMRAKYDLALTNVVIVCLCQLSPIYTCYAYTHSPHRNWFINKILNLIWALLQVHTLSLDSI